MSTCHATFKSIASQSTKGRTQVIASSREARKWSRKKIVSPNRLRNLERNSRSGTVNSNLRSSPRTLTSIRKRQNDVPNLCSMGSRVPRASRNFTRKIRRGQENWSRNAMSGTEANLILWRLNQLSMNAVERCTKPNWSRLQLIRLLRVKINPTRELGPTLSRGTARAILIVAFRLWRIRIE